MLPPNRTRLKKTFGIKTWDGGLQGEKMLVYGKSGMGKTTLASMAPRPVFIGLDDGGRKIRNPKTNEALRFVDGITTFDDVRDVLRSTSLFENNKTIVIDTVTALEFLCTAHVIKTVPAKDNVPATNIESYGWGKGYRHLLDFMSLILQDCDALVKVGKNILFLAQNQLARQSNAEGDDYLADMPSLYCGKWSVADRYIEWADHVLIIRDVGLAVGKDKKVKGGQDRAVFTIKQPYYAAKSRPLVDGSHLPEAISFASAEDDSLWTFLFGGKQDETKADDN